MTSINKIENKYLKFKRTTIWNSSKILEDQILNLKLLKPKKLSRLILVSILHMKKILNITSP